MSTSIILIMVISILRLAIPVIITGLGNMFSEKVGIMNLGAEGMMTAGAFGAVIGAYVTGNAWIGVLCGMLSGMLMSAIHALISVEFGGLQNISGLGINMLAAGVTAFLCRSFFGNSITPSVQSIQTTDFLAKVPYIGKFLQQFSPIAYIAIIILILSWIIVNKTIAGLRMTSVGDDPKTVETAGINVWKIRHISVLICGILAGLSGAYLSLGQLNIFMVDMVTGKGMLAVIAVKMGRWEPIRIVLIALLFGFFDALQLQLQINNALNIAPELIQTIPFVVGIIALAFDSKGNVAPRAIRQPYLKNKYKF